MVNAEKAVIGCLMLDIDGFEKINLTHDMFFDSDLGRVFLELKHFYDRDEKPDVSLIQANLKDIIGLTELLVECMESVTMSVNIDQYTEIVERDYKARQLISIINFRPDEKNIDRQIEETIHKLELLEENKSDSAETIGELADRFKGERFVANRKQGLKTGIGELDKIVCGMDDGDVILVAARPAVGKTAFGMQIALEVSKSLNTSFISLEMTKEQLYDRIISNVSGIDFSRIRRACNTIGEEGRLFDEGNEELKGRKLTIVDDIDTVDDMYRHLKKHKSRLAVIDYAQLIKSDGKYGNNRYAEVGQISHGIKKMAKRLKIPIILLTQLNRAKDETSEPSMSEIRESGDFEQDASVIILLWNKTADRRTKGVKVDKNRSGDTGKIEMDFDGKLMRFREFRKVDETPFG